MNSARTRLVGFVGKTAAREPLPSVLQLHVLLDPKLPRQPRRLPWPFDFDIPLIEDDAVIHKELSEDPIACWLKFCLVPSAPGHAMQLAYRPTKP
jgi:hypothetical protein